MCVLAKTILTQTVFLVLSVSAFAASDETQFLATGGGPIEVGPLDSVDHEIDELHPSIVAKARAMAPSSTGISPSVSRLARASNQKLDFPLRLREHVQAPRVHSITNFVDLNSSNGLKDFNCGKRTYDGHNGIDYILGIYAWRSMDDNEVEIVAAAPGVIVDKQDGHFDRQCSWGPFPANYVIIQQDDGLFAYYWHMKKGSVIKRPVGDRVRKSEYLGLVGSSGSSTTPHLHFELRDANGATIDPYAGKCGAKKTIWKHQPEAVDTEIISVRTHSARPQPPRSFCHKPEPSYSDTFAPGDRIWIVAYLRDQTSSAPARIELVRPDGLVHASWRSRTPPKRRVNTLAWYWGDTSIPASGPEGQWTARVTVQGQSNEHTLSVGKKPGKTKVRGLVSPQARSLKLKKWGDVIVVAENTGRSKAVGCWVAPDTPMAAKYAFHSLDEAGQPSGAANANFEIPGRSSREIRLSFFGAAKASALGAEIPIRIKCHNADGTAPQNGFNTMWLSLNKKRKPDIIPEAQLKNDFLKLRKVGSSRKVRVVSVNHGKTGRVKVSAQKSHKALPVKLNVCELNQKTNKCIGQPRTSLDRIVTAGETVHWRVVVKATAKIPKNIVKNRVVFEMLDKGGINRGQTTFAVQTK